MDKLHTIFTITVEVLSPLHIGTGSQLIRDLDFVTHDDQTWVINQDAFWSHIMAQHDGQINNSLMSRPISKLLKDADYGQADIFRYKLRGLPAAANKYIGLQIKDVFGQPYLPGSTLKGLLRTLFIWGHYVTNKKTPNLYKLNTRSKDKAFTGQPLEHTAVGANPNLDVLRAFHVADSDPIAVNRLSLARVNIYPTKKNDRSSGVVTNVEAISPESKFISRLAIEEYGFQDRKASIELGWGSGKRREFENLVQNGKLFAQRRLAQEISYYQSHSNVDWLLDEYNKLSLLNETLDNRQFLAQIGWGTGWNSKTLNDLIMADQSRFVEIVRTYKLTRFANTFQSGDPFPASRHLIESGGDNKLPMGWVKVTIDRVP